MVKTKILVVRITPEQEKVLEARARSMGFLRKSDYVRYSIFIKGEDK